METVNTFINKIDNIFLEEHKVPLMNMALQSTSARWWGNHQKYLHSWEQVVKDLRTRFQALAVQQIEENYKGNSDP